MEAVILIYLFANFCYLGKESLGEELGEKMRFVCKFMFFQQKITTVVQSEIDDDDNNNNVKVLKRTSSSEFLGHLEAYYCSI